MTKSKIDGSLSRETLCGAVRSSAAAALCLLSLGACASTAGPSVSADRTADRPCTRLEAAQGLTRKWVVNAVPRMSQPAAEACGRGNLFGCAAVPLAAATAILFTPFVPIVGASASEANAKHHCS